MWQTRDMPSSINHTFITLLSASPATESARERSIRYIKAIKHQHQRQRDCLYACLSVCVSVPLRTCSSACLSACISVFMSVRLRVCPSVFVEVCLSARLCSVPLRLCASVSVTSSNCLYVCDPVYLFVCDRIYLFLYL